MSVAQRMIAEARWASLPPVAGMLKSAAMRSAVATAWSDGQLPL
jgi:hypothetical protein